VSSSAGFDPGRSYRCSPSVALRPEPFGALVYHFGTRRLSFLKTPQLLTVVSGLTEHPDVGSALDAAGVDHAQRPRLSARPGRPGRERNHRGDRAAVKLVEHFQYGLNSPICLTWEHTYACNLACVHCLSSSGRRDPRELSTDECKAVVDELQHMQVFYVNIGGGEPTVRPDFWELLDYAISHDVGSNSPPTGSSSTRSALRSWPPPTTSTSRFRWMGRPPRSTTTSAAPAPTTPRSALWRTWPRPGSATRRSAW
jgi:putative mycofactocin binding protein MftB